MQKEYDLVVLGGGTGGYVAAIKASQLGMSVAIVEERKLGGTCLHRGCIPTKAFLRSAEVYHTLKHAEEYGIKAGELGYDFSAVYQRKQGIVAKLEQGIAFLMKKNKVDVYNSRGSIMGPSIFSPLPGAVATTLKDDNGEDIILVPGHLLIATGSEPSSLPGLDFDGKQVLSSDHALDLEKLPASVCIIGGGVIGIEWASIFADFGVETTVLEFAKQIIPMADSDIAKEITKQLKKKGVKIVTEAKVDGSSLEKSPAQVKLSADVKGKKQEFNAEVILVAVGRKANTENLGLDNTKIELEKGHIKTNENYRTKEKHIYAIGDVIGGLQLAHVASAEGERTVEAISGHSPTPINYHHVPKCIYTNPEIASVGLSEEQAVEAGYEVKCGRFDFKSLGKAMVYGDTSGFVKIVSCAKSKDLLGVHIVGPHATELISEAALAQLLDATAWEIGSTIHPHPTLAEAIMEASLDVDGMAIHK